MGCAAHRVVDALWGERTLPTVKASPSDVRRECKTRLIEVAIQVSTSLDFFVVEVGDGRWARAARQVDEVDDFSLVGLGPTGDAPDR